MLEAIEKHPFLKIGVYLLILGIIACGGNSTNNGDQNSNQVADSVTLWLEYGKNPDLPSDSRQRFLNKATENISENAPDTLKINYYSQLSLAYLRLGDSLRFRENNRELQNLAQALEDKRELANSNWDLANFFSSKSLRDSAFYYYYSAHSLYKELGNLKYSGRLLYNMATEQQKARAYVESEKTTFEAIEILEPIKDTTHLFLCYNNLGSITKELKEYDRSLGFFKKAEEYLNLMDENDRIRYKRSLENNLGNLYKEQGKWQEAIPYFEAALDYEGLETKRPRAYAQTLNNLAISRFLSGDTINVLADLSKAYRINLLENNNQGLSTTSFNLATYYNKLGRTEEAIFHAQNALEQAELSSNYKRKLESLKLLGSIAPDKDQYFNEYVSLSERLQSEERQIRDKFARIERETDEALAAAATLAKERQLILGIALGLILLAIAGLIIITQRIRVQRLRFEQEQQEANQEIFNLMLSQKQKVEEGKQSEQKRISEELHDGVLGALNGIRMVLLGLNGKSDDNAMAMRSDAIDKLKDVQEEIRAISHELNDAAYQKFNNFIASIQDLIRETEASSGLSIELNYDEDLEWDGLNGEIKINLYRIVQESIQNVVKHAHASKVKLDLILWDNMLKITISDDGRGFNTRKMKKGIGHRNIKSRVEKINGSWNIESSIGKGAHITVILPYDTEAPQANMLVNVEGELQQIKKD
ncbi:ATP-binding protein [Lentiprolixibacter aurantiacus]|uniref:histidine kinase n=1 Tax=Lentiprolixibacter aurantiacus TaxID=2993939 RepID=A0AAE3MKE5_9FLAO|nr:tetratricopeptide repeat-containing sensor histidine kinase [Lentiprolixibacter aurantiacus]MCX2719410.1 tetratricopeptide repeat protein [Lentiprolixibacter aurantiacus]